MEGHYLVNKARVKLSSEVARPNWNLRLLVGHANLIDSLVFKLAEQEPLPPSNRLFHKPKCQRNHVQQFVADADRSEEIIKVGNTVTMPGELSIRSPPSSGEGGLAEGISDEDCNNLTLIRSPSGPARPQLEVAEEKSGLPLTNQRALP